MFQNLWQPFKLLPIFGVFAIAPVFLKEGSDDFTMSSDVPTFAAPKLGPSGSSFSGALSQKTLEPLEVTEILTDTKTPGLAKALTRRWSNLGRKEQKFTDGTCVLLGRTSRASFWVYSTKLILQKLNIDDASDWMSPPQFVGEISNIAELDSLMENWTSKKRIQKPDPVEWITFGDSLRIPANANVTTTDPIYQQPSPPPKRSKTDYKPHTAPKTHMAKLDHEMIAIHGMEVFKSHNLIPLGSNSISRVGLDVGYDFIESKGSKLDCGFYTVGSGRKMGVSLAWTSCNNVLVLCHALEGNDKSIIFDKCATPQKIRDALDMIRVQIMFGVTKPEEFDAPINPARNPDDLAGVEWIKCGGQVLDLQNLKTDMVKPDEVKPDEDSIWKGDDVARFDCRAWRE